MDELNTNNHEPTKLNEEYGGIQVKIQFVTNKHTHEIETKWVNRGEIVLHSNKHQVRTPVQLPEITIIQNRNQRVKTKTSDYTYNEQWE